MAVLLTANAGAVLTTNKWAAAFGSGKWESGANWNNGVPSINFSMHLLRPISGIDAFATIDVATVASNVINSCLTISNLTVVGNLAGTPATLSLDNANNTPGNAGLLVISNLTVGSGGSVTITNSRLRVVGSPPVVNGVYNDVMYNNGFMLLRTGELVTSNGWAYLGNAGTGQMTVLDGTWQAGGVAVGIGGQGTLTLAGGTTSVLLGLSIGFNAYNYPFGTGIGTVWLTGGELVSTNTIYKFQNSPDDYNHRADVQIGGRAGVGQMTVSNGTCHVSNVDVEGGTLTIAGGTTTFSETSLYAPSSGMYIGTFGTGTVWMTGGQLTVTNDLSSTYVGFACDTCQGAGQMTISNGTYLAKTVIVVARDELNDYPANESGNGTLTVAGGTSVISSNLTIGNRFCTGFGVVKVAGGALFVTNATHSAVIDVRGGTLRLNSGTLTVDKLVMTNYCAHFIRTGGTLSITATNLNPAFDADGDGLPNDWELQNGFDPFDETTGVQDADGDGLDNYVEYLAGTDPRNPADPFRVTGISRESNNIRVTWEFLTPPGNPYDHCVVEGSKVITGTWNNVSGTMTLPSGFFDIVTTNYLDVGGATNFPSRFYRVRLVP